MKLERIVLALGGLIGIAGFFLPFLHLDTAALGLAKGEVSMSGFSNVMSLLDNFDVLVFEGDQRWLQWSSELWSAASTPIDIGKAVGLSLILSLPLFLLLYSLGHLLRGLFGGQYKRGVMLNLLFMGVAWGVFYLISMDGSYTFLGEEATSPLNFFKIAGPGYWMAFAGIMVAGMSLFFEKKGK